MNLRKPVATFANKKLRLMAVGLRYWEAINYTRERINCYFRFWWAILMKKLCKTCQSIQYKDSFVENYPMKEQLSKSVLDPIIA